MSIDKHMQTTEKKMSVRTLCFLLNQDKVLLGKKKKGLGKGNYVGIGGKMEDKDKTVLDAIIRDVEEEVNVTPNNLREVAVITFLFPEKPEWEMIVHAYTSDSWQGVPRETDEIMPVWFKKEEIPYAEMWDDAKYWLPKVLKGEKLRAIFTYDTNIKVKEHKITEY